VPSAKARRITEATRRPRAARGAQPALLTSRTPAAQNGGVATPTLRQRIYAVVRRIPRGRVATYGQVARLAGLAGHARQVGYALAALPEAQQGVPWHRVINAQGGVSARAEPGWDDVQRQLLRREGVAFDRSGRTSLARFQWRPRSPR
jgi:methylated-DNA-protein-cysteine methyltransferase-like protein